MNIDILTVLPELLESPFGHSIVKRAREKGLLTIRVHHLRQWAVNEYGQVDDYQYGGGAGMVMMPEPLANAIESLAQDVSLALADDVADPGQRCRRPCPTMSQTLGFTSALNDGAGDILEISGSCPRKTGDRD